MINSAMMCVNFEVTWSALDISDKASSLGDVPVIASLVISAPGVPGPGEHLVLQYKEYLTLISSLPKVGVAKLH